MQALSRVDCQLAKFEEWIIIGLTASLSLLLIVQVFMRYILNSPLFWAEEVAVQLLVFISFFGVSLLVFKKKMVSVDLLMIVISERSRVILQLLIHIFSLVILVLFLLLSFDWINQPEVRVEVSATTGLPRWYNYSLMVVAFLFLVFHQFVLCIQQTGLVFGRGDNV